MASRMAEMSKRKHSRHEIAEDLALIRHLLKRLKERKATEPELEEAIMRLDILMGALTASSGGML